MGFNPKRFVKHLPQTPGVYRMFDITGELLYVGKARNLKNRVSSYFNASVKSRKTEALVAQIADVQITVTHTEGEALLLESNLIKAHHPKYNVLLRDDKSYPYIYLSDHEFPRLSLYRGSKPKKGKLYGPYPSAQAAKETLKLLQKLFPVRQCEDHYYAHRSRPCLQYQIKRCSAPCVGLVSPSEYAEDMQHALLFLEGKNHSLIEHLGKQMNQASDALEFERAAHLRDKIQHLKKVQERQYVDSGNQDVDVIAGLFEGGLYVVQVFTVRGGRNLGNREFFPKVPPESTVTEVLQEFIGQYYQMRPAPGEILVNDMPDDASLVSEALSEQYSRKVVLSRPVRGDRLRWMNMAINNAKVAIQQRLAKSTQVGERLDALQQLLELPETPALIECFDISHHAGEQTQASCVVHDGTGINKQLYRRFKLQDVAPGDDYAAIYEAVWRRYKRQIEEDKPLPDVLLIDGGKGQVAKAKEALDELQLDLLVIGISKGPDRKPGEELLVFADHRGVVRLPSHHVALHLLMQIRDEAHRFAISGVRMQRDKKRGRSSLEEIDGLGPKRRKALLQHFGGLKTIQSAGVDDLAQVEGINQNLARRIYEYFHSD